MRIVSGGPRVQFDRELRVVYDTGESADILAVVLAINAFLAPRCVPRFPQQLHVSFSHAYDNLLQAVGQKCNFSPCSLHLTTTRIGPLCKVPTSQAGQLFARCLWQDLL